MGEPHATTAIVARQNLPAAQGETGIVDAVAGEPKPDGDPEPSWRGRPRLGGARRHRTPLLAIGGALLSAILLTMQPIPAQAQFKAASPNEPDQGPLYRFGQSLLEKGILIRGNYIGEFAANPSGGDRQGDRYAGQADLGLDLDLQRILAVPSAAVHLTVSQRHGRSLARDDIGNTTSVQEIFGGGQTYRLSELSYDQALFDDKVEYLVGRITANTDFAQSPIYCNFQSNSTCGNPAFFGRDSNFVFFPVPSWGGRVTLKPFTPRVYLQVGAYDVDPSQAQRNHHGFDWGTGRSTGALIPLELGYQTTFRSDPMPRHYKIGGFWDDSDYTDPYFDDSGRAAAITGAPFKTRRGRTGIYALFDQMIWRPDPTRERGLILFGGVAAGTSAHQVENWFAQIGLFQQGTFQNRDEDTIGFVFTDQHFSNAALDSVAAARTTVGGSGRPPADEYMMELNYGAQVTPWLRVVPNLQWVVNPDQFGRPTRTTNISDAFVIGIKFAVGLPQLAGMPTQKYAH